MKRTLSVALSTLALTAASSAMAAGVSFDSPADGATVPQSFTVKMAVEGMQVQPAGQATDGSGHHHLIVDGGPVAQGTPVPADATHLHFGKGQTETALTLPPGTHTLTLQFADGLHRSFGPGMSRTITVHVQ